MTVVSERHDSELLTISKRDEVYRIPGYPELKMRHVWGSINIDGAEDVSISAFREVVQDPRWIVDVKATLELSRDKWPEMAHGHAALHLKCRGVDVIVCGDYISSWEREVSDTTITNTAFEKAKELNMHWPHQAIFYDEDDVMEVTMDASKTGTTGKIWVDYHMYITYVEKP